MIATFNALLDIARAEAGSERGGFEVVDLEALGHDLADLYRPAAEDKQLTLEYRCAPVLQMRANRHLLAQALANLLDNAIKYTPPGGRVDLEIERGASGPIIAVADNGPGIPETDRERVLQRFVRLDGTRSTPGNGLGLSLVDAVAKLHGAELALSDNRPGLRSAWHSAPCSRSGLRRLRPDPSARSPPARRRRRRRSRAGREARQRTLRDRDDHRPDACIDDIEMRLRRGQQPGLQLRRGLLPASFEQSPRAHAPALVTGRRASSSKEKRRRCAAAAGMPARCGPRPPLENSLRAW